MVQNDFIDIDKTESYVGTEPVTLAEAKAHCYIDGAQDDAKISDLIGECREVVENYCHISIVEKTITATMEISNTLSTRYYAAAGNLNPSNSGQPYNDIELPFGPIKAVSKITSISSNGVANDLVEGEDYSVKGTLYKTLCMFGAYGTNILIYTTGYINVPGGLKLAILNEIAFRYEHRGDKGKRYEIGELCPDAEGFAKKYRRMAWQ